MLLCGWFGTRAGVRGLLHPVPCSFICLLPLLYHALSKNTRFISDYFTRNSGGRWPPLRFSGPVRAEKPPSPRREKGPLEQERSGLRQKAPVPPQGKAFHPQGGRCPRRGRMRGRGGDAVFTIRGDTLTAPSSVTACGRATFPLEGGRLLGVCFHRVLFGHVDLPQTGKVFCASAPRIFSACTLSKPRKMCYAYSEKISPLHSRGG